MKQSYDNKKSGMAWKTEKKSSSKKACGCGCNNMNDDDDDEVIELETAEWTSK